LSSGSRIRTGADDAAGLAIADGLQANVTGLTQSVANANSGVGALQVADGALGQVTTLLNRAATPATEAPTGTVSSAQRGALDVEYQQILQQIDSIGSNTTFNGTAIFAASGTTTTSIFLSDSSTAHGSRPICNSPSPPLLRPPRMQIRPSTPAKPANLLPFTCEDRAPMRDSLEVAREVHSSLREWLERARKFPAPAAQPPGTLERLSQQLKRVDQAILDADLSLVATGD
jgi:hypothetical protein